MYSTFNRVLLDFLQTVRLIRTGHFGSNGVLNSIQLYYIYSFKKGILGIHNWGAALCFCNILWLFLVGFSRYNYSIYHPIIKTVRLIGTEHIKRSRPRFLNLWYV